MRIPWLLVPLATCSLALPLVAQGYVEVSSLNALAWTVKDSTPGTVVQITVSQMTWAYPLDVTNGVTILGAPGTGTTIQSDHTLLKIHDLPADQQLVLRGLTYEGATDFPAGADWGWDCVRVDDCAGAVVFEDCFIRGMRGSNALYAQNSPRIFLERSTFEGGRGFLIGLSLGGPATDWGGNGLYLDQCGAWLQDSTIIGGDGLTGLISSGSSSNWAYSTKPGQGAFLDTSSLQAVASHFKGGLGAPGGAGQTPGQPGPCMASPTSGGSAVDITLSSSASLHGCTFEPGLGLQSPCAPIKGADGKEVAGADQPGSSLEQTDQLYGLQALTPVLTSSPLPPGPASFGLTGEANSLAFVLVSPALATPLDTDSGFDLCVDAADLWIGAAGVTDAAGALTWNVSVPPVPTGGAPLRTWVQGAVIGFETGIPYATVLPPVTTTVVP